MFKLTLTAPYHFFIRSHRLCSAADPRDNTSPNKILVYIDVT